MDFKVALSEIYESAQNKQTLCSPFFLYSQLSDLCSDSFEGRKKTELFYSIDKEINLFSCIYKGECDFSSDYEKVSDIIGERSFFHLVTAVIETVSPQIKAMVPTANDQKARKPTPAVVVKADESEPEATRTPLTTSTPSSSTATGCLIALGVPLGIALLVCFALKVNIGWGVWQWVIGIAGGLVLATILSLTVAWLDDDCIADFYVMGTVFVGIFTFLNFIALLIFQGSYKVIFSCFGVIELFLGLFLALVSFDELEKGWGTCQIVECVITLALLIAGITCV